MKFFAQHGGDEFTQCLRGCERRRQIGQQTIRLVHATDAQQQRGAINIGGFAGLIRGKFCERGEQVAVAIRRE